MRSCGCNHPDIDRELKQLRERLQYYLEREREILDKNGIKSYGIGSRNASRYDTALKDVWDIIKQLRAEIAELEALRCGRQPRKAVGVIPRDNY